jgi:hypothetical protein
MTVCTRCRSAFSLGCGVWYVERWRNKHTVMQEVLMLRWRCAVEGSEAIGSLSAPTTNPSTTCLRQSQWPHRCIAARRQLTSPVAAIQSACRCRYRYLRDVQPGRARSTASSIGEKKHDTKDARSSRERCDNTRTCDENPHGCDKWRRDLRGFCDEQPPMLRCHSHRTRRVSVLLRVEPPSGPPPPAVAECLVHEAEASPTQV